MEAIDERVQEAGMLPAGGADAGPGRPMTPVDLERITPVKLALASLAIMDCPFRRQDQQ